MTLDQASDVLISRIGVQLIDLEVLRLAEISCERIAFEDLPDDEAVDLLERVYREEARDGVD